MKLNWVTTVHQIDANVNPCTPPTSSVEVCTQTLCTYHRQQNLCFHKVVYLFISKLHSILAVANLLARNNIRQICCCGQISFGLQFSGNLTSMGVTVITQVMIHESMRVWLQSGRNKGRTSKTLQMHNAYLWLVGQHQSLQISNLASNHFIKMKDL